MSEGDNNSNRFLARIRQELNKLPLSEDQKDKLTPELLRCANFLNTKGGRSAPGELAPESAFFAFADKIQSVVSQFQNDGLTIEGYLTVVSRNPTLMVMNPETVGSHIRSVVAHFAADGMTTRNCLKAALKQPQLFYQSPQATARCIEEVVERFASNGLTTPDFLQAVLNEPQIFWQSPQTTVRHIEEVVQRFETQGLTTESYLQAALKQPSLFTQSPATIAGNVEGVIERFAADGLTSRDYLRAALKQPSLFATTPDTIAHHVTPVVDRFAADGLTLREYLDAARRQPALFTMASETVARHIDTVLSLADSGIFTPPTPRGRLRSGPSAHRSHSAVIDFLLKSPSIMCLADDNFGLREIHQRLTDGPTNGRLLQRSRRDTEHDLMRHLAHDDPQEPVPADGFVAGGMPPTEEQARRLVLRALIHAGFIRSASLER